MTLADHVRIARRFQRAVRIDVDSGDSQSIEGFICPQSSASVLLTTAQHVAQTGHGAFTWTGPYGSGKSSLVVALGALLGPNKRLRTLAEKAIGCEAAREIKANMPPKARGWRILPVVGRREDPALVIGEAIEAAGIGSRGRAKAWTEERVVDALAEGAQAESGNSGGIVLFVDEMGKFLEAAAQDGADIYLFQLLAEAASRSGGRLVVIGILHQAFEEYATRLTREMRDEWSKIQGRFLDLAVNAAGEEQIVLIARAIESDRGVVRPGKLAGAVAAEIKRRQPAASDYLADVLEDCWPLHPVVACLLGPISRRRFGQNQRSIFGFLNSAEPFGFQEFIRHSSVKALYEPDRLWGYLRANLEPSILASPDGHRWALAADAIERSEALGAEDLPVRLLKTIALVDLFKERSGVSACREILGLCLSGAASADIDAALKTLEAWSLIVFRKFNDSYAIFAGSDFDIDDAVREALGNAADVDFLVLRRLAGLQPVLAKRHYHRTGTLRWFDVEVAPVGTLAERAAAYRPKNGTIGQFLLAVPTEGESEQHATAACREAAQKADAWDIVVGLSQRSWGITDLARELIALEGVRDQHPELAHDPVARREVLARLTALQGQLEEELHRAFDSAVWHLKHHAARRRYHAELNGIASELADRRYPKAPVLHNELLNRIRPSSNAVAAQNALLRLMVSNEGKERLGIDGFPAEGGLFASLLDATGLYRKIKGQWRFEPPSDDCDRSGIAPLWDAAAAYLKTADDRTVNVSELYDLWRAPPFGVRDGLMPVLAVAFILSRRDTVALYREGVFQARFKDVDVEILAKDAADIQLRWMDLSVLSRRLLSSMAEIVRDLDKENSLVHLAPIDVARGLIAIFERLHPWTKRTMQLSSNADNIRSLFKRASDPNKFLFDDIPETIGSAGGTSSEAALSRIVENVREGLDELVQAYPAMLQRLRDMMLAELQVPNASPRSLSELRGRAENIRQLGGDFQVDAFIGRLATFEGSQADIEGIASLAARKPPRDWVDADLDRAAVEIADMAQIFVRAETFARVKGRRGKRHAMAVMVGIDGRPAPVHEEFSIADTERASVDELVVRVQAALEGADAGSRNVILAALAELSARYIDPASGLDDESLERVVR
jgi:hypothetical protein